MRLISCYINNFGCYTNKKFDFSKGTTSFCLDNGAGKTTLAVFLKAMFYALPKATKTAYERTHYKPYLGGKYAGSVDIEIGNELYHIEREFAESKSKDKLRIIDSTGLELESFLSKNIAEMQGENSSLLGELIFGIDEEAFKRVNFISSNDSDFASNESIKMKIWDVAINRDYEKSFEDAMASIEQDLREKKPTQKNENAYPYLVKELKVKNNELLRQIKQLDGQEPELSRLYALRENIMNELDLVNKEQDKLETKLLKKGQWESVKQIDGDIARENAIIDKVETKYKAAPFSLEEISNFTENLSLYQSLSAVNTSLDISPQDFDKMSSLKDKLFSSSDYELLLKHNEKIVTIEKQLKEILSAFSAKRFALLKERYEDKELVDINVLQRKLFDYQHLLEELKKLDVTSLSASNDFPSSETLLLINSKISELEKLNLEIEKLRSSYKEPPLFLRIMFTVFTFGIYFVALRKKRKHFALIYDEKEEIIKKKEDELESFFAKYKKVSGGFSLRLSELKDEISKNNNRLLEEKINSLNVEIASRKEELLSYFAKFDLSDESNIEELFMRYRKELNEYNGLLSLDKRKDELLKEKESLTKQIDEILDKYHFVRNEDFAMQLSQIKRDIDFYKSNERIYLQRKENDQKLLSLKEEISLLLSKHNLVLEDDVIHQVRIVIEEYNQYQKAISERTLLEDKRKKIIADNDLSNYEEDEEISLESLSSKRLEINVRLKEVEANIESLEDDLSRREVFEEQIEDNNSQIKEYEEKIKIINLAKKILVDANNDLERKYIGPVKDSFEKYAKKIHEKIGTDIKMNYEYQITYLVNGLQHKSDDLSDGERTIMMLALRFAILDAIYKNHDSLIILDDPFESLDEEKIAKAKALLLELSKEWQIIYFSCHPSRAIEG